jgi:hypothetical protein
MRKLLIILLVITLENSISGQTLSSLTEGIVSYVTSQNVYVKFESTDGLSAGDTLYSTVNGKHIPSLIITDLSSISCVCTSIVQVKYAAGDKITAKPRLTTPPVIAVKNDEPATIPVPKAVTELSKDTASDTKSVQRISGRLSLASYSNFSSAAEFSQRLRYNFSLNASNIKGSGFSAETYITFAHRLKEWDEIKTDVFNGLKIYNLSLGYEFKKRLKITAGRKINPRLANAGAIDGLQAELKLGTLSVGAVAGSRPDYLNYSLNTALFQYGAYLAHDYSSPGGNMQNSLAFVEQKNHGFTDRRFVYFQHNNTLLQKLYVFASLEADLYSMSRNVADSSLSSDNRPKLSNLYASLRYKFSKQLSASLSYSSRQNIIYYETYKDIIDRLLESQSSQGYMAQITYRPLKSLSFGINAGYRTSKNDPRPTKNVYGYATYNNIPFLKAAVTASATLIETGYLNSSIYSLGLTKDLLPGKVSGGVNYRWVNYKFRSAETPLVQHMAEFNLYWRLMKKLSCSINFEGTFEKNRNYERVYFNITQRF